VIALGDPVQQCDLTNNIDFPGIYDFYRLRDTTDEIYIVKRKRKTITVLRKIPQSESVPPRPSKEPRLQTARPGRVADGYRSAQPNSHIDQANTVRDPSVADSLYADNTSTGSRALPAHLPMPSSVIARTPLKCLDCNEKLSIPQKCSSCDEEFVELKELTYHLLNHHSEADTFKVKCAPCELELKNHCHWAEHLRTTHNFGEKPLPCPGCDEKFPTNYKLKQHYKAHPVGSHGRPKPCPTCIRNNTGKRNPGQFAKGCFDFGSDECMICGFRE
jgi:hypothetical protein